MLLFFLHHTKLLYFHLNNSHYFELKSLKKDEMWLFTHGYKNINQIRFTIFYNSYDGHSDKSREFGQMIYHPDQNLEFGQMISHTDEIVKFSQMTGLFDQNAEFGLMNSHFIKMENSVRWLVPLMKMQICSDELLSWSSEWLHDWSLRSKHKIGQRTCNPD